MKQANRFVEGALESGPLGIAAAQADRAAVAIIAPGRAIDAPKSQRRNWRIVCDIIARTGMSGLKQPSRIGMLGIPNRNVELGNGFVRHDQLGANPQDPRDRNPLQLASRELMRKTPRLIARQTDPLEKLADFRLKVFAATNAMQPKRQRDRVSNPEAWIERREWVLKHQLQIATMQLQLPLRGQPLRTRYDRSLPSTFRASLSQGRLAAT